MNAHPKVVFTRQADYRPAGHVAEGAPPELATSWAEARVASGDLTTEVSG